MHNIGIMIRDFIFCKLVLLYMYYDNVRIMMIRIYLSAEG